MSKQMNALNESYDKYNKTYNKLRPTIVKALRDPDTNSPEAELALKMLDQSDAVMDDIVRTLAELTSKIETIKP